MKPEIKKMWVEALRSGEYRQGRGALRAGDAFCCLGVLCDLHSKVIGISWKNNGYLGYTALLPQAVCEWAELIDNPRVRGTEITVPNDDGVTFPEIADLIEQHL